MGERDQNAQPHKRSLHIDLELIIIVDDNEEFRIRRKATWEVILAQW